MKLSKFANLVKAGGRCAVLHVAGTTVSIEAGTFVSIEAAGALSVTAAPNGLWCSACRCKVDGELIFYNEAYLAPLAEEIKKSEYIYYTARQTQTGQRYLVVHDGMDVLAAIMPMNILKEEYINDLAEFQALCMEQFYKDKERREAVIEEAEDDAEDAGQIGMEGVQE